MRSLLRHFECRRRCAASSLAAVSAATLTTLSATLTTLHRRCRRRLGCCVRVSLCLYHRRELRLGLC